MKIKPLGDKVVIKMVETEETTKSGIVSLCWKMAQYVSF